MKKVSNTLIPKYLNILLINNYLSHDELIDNTFESFFKIETLKIESDFVKFNFY